MDADGKLTIRLARWLVAAIVAIGSSGCMDAVSTAEFPELKAEKKVLTKEEQAQAMAELRRKSEQQPSEVVRQIETGSNKSVRP